MYFKTLYSLAASLTLVLFMPCSVSAAPWMRRDLAGGTQVPLPNRLSPTSPDGIFDHEEAARLGRKAFYKHQSNLRNLQTNTKGIPEESGMKILDLSSLTRQATAHVRRGDGPSQVKSFNGGTHALGRRFKKEDGAGEPLKDVGSNTEWDMKLKVGPESGFEIDCDTGSSDFWVVNADCTTGPCADKSQKYDPSKSKTSDREPGTFTILYGDHSTVKGPIFSDDVTIAGITVKNQTFSAVTKESNAFENDPSSGIMGFGWPVISNLGTPPWFLNAVQQGVIKKREFGFYLSSKRGSEIYLGGTNPEHYEGSLEYHEVDSREGFWKVKDGNIHLGDEAVLKNFPTIIDSGTTLMYGPPAAVKEFYSKVEGAKVYDEEEGFYTFPCDKVPKVVLSWGKEGKKFAIPPEYFNLGKAGEGSSSCVGALAASDLGLGEAWLYGDVVMRSFYTAFRFGEKEINKGAVVGFAKLKEKK
ncbi:acid protease [Lentinula raphanica]|nr:acid protease [Lentinula raphanica]